MKELISGLDEKAQSVLNYYVFCNKLKNVMRKGWQDWGVKRERLESVAEHIYGVQMLAIAMRSEFGYGVNIEKVLKMLAVHEIEKIIIGDLTLFDIDSETKLKIGHDAVQKILSPLIDGEEYIKLITEFDERQTPEAKFAYHCDKLEADLQARMYDLEGCMKKVKLYKNKRYKDSPDVRNLLNSGLSWGQMWLKFGWMRYNYDENFLAVSKFAFENDILRNFNKK